MRAPKLVFAALLMLTGCATLVPGTSREAEVTAYFGQPAEQRKLPDGGRELDFPRAPAGRQNWRVTLGPDGVVRSVEQLLDEAHFERLKKGMTVDEVKRVLSQNGEQAAYPALQEEVLSWRYLDVGSRDMFFNAHFDSSGHFKYSSRTEETIPSNESNSP